MEMRVNWRKPTSSDASFCFLEREPNISRENLAAISHLASILDRCFCFIVLFDQGSAYSRNRKVA